IYNHNIVDDKSELVKSYHIKSPHGEHITYDQYVNGWKVLYSGVKIHLHSNGSYNIQNYLAPAENAPTEINADFLLPTVDGLVGVSQRFDENILAPTVQFLNENGDILLEVDRMKHYKTDTTLFSKVFMVNPINSSGMSYGGRFKDNGDQTNSSLDSQMVWVANDVKFDSGLFILESEFLKFKDLSAPIDSEAIFISDSADISRDKSLFENLNVYYHINTVGKYINRLGYDSLTKQLLVDPHAFGGTDNSGYLPSNHSLQFGDGGVDDAEDGEVVIHEFIHSVSEIASPDNTDGAEREAMEEGTCDYFSKAYSRSINDNTANQIFSWDGHNEYWDGIDIYTKRNYPDDLKGNKDGDRDMWSSALMCGHDKIGRLQMDSIVLEHLYYQGAHTTMTQMAQIILDIDSSDFQKRYYSELKTCFVDAGFLKRGVGIRDLSVASPFKIYNQAGFASGEGNISIDLPNNAYYSIVNSLGQIITNNERSGKLVLNPKDFKSGLYVVYITIDNSTFTQKILR
ncbi:T9SS type A sorting domain-containing protein, partial [Bacteroidia bacterium]|nr:T9SS type A sorting domain-containing protein [Bacteroidia bacterium]